MSQPTLPNGTAPRLLRQDDSLEVEKLLRRKGDLRISVCLPALNEAATITDICTRIGQLVQVGLVDEQVVVDSGSTDGTAEAAAAGGASVVHVDQVLPEVVASGKGGAMWKSLAVASGDIVVWLDSDIRNFDNGFVLRLVAPLLEDDSIRMTKAFYDRPLEVEGVRLATGGARVTELVVRPLAHLLFPELTGFVQPLSGEYAGYRDDLLELPFFSGYAVEVGILIDFIRRHGLEAIAQVDLGWRVHRNQDIPALGRMAFEVMTAMTMRAEDLGRLKLTAEATGEFVQFASGEVGPVKKSYRLEVIELPPMRTLL